MGGDDWGFSVWAHNAGTGGCGPVDKGKIGEALSEAEAAAAGEKVIGKQVTLELPSGKWPRPDNLTEAPGGGLKVREAKNGPNARLTPNQEELQEMSIRSAAISSTLSLRRMPATDYAHTFAHKSVYIRASAAETLPRNALGMCEEIVVTNKEAGQRASRKKGGHQDQNRVLHRNHSR